MDSNRWKSQKAKGESKSWFDLMRSIYYTSTFLYKDGLSLLMEYGWEMRMTTPRMKAWHWAWPNHFQFFFSRNWESGQGDFRISISVTDSHDSKVLVDRVNRRVRPLSLNLLETKKSLHHANALHDFWMILFLFRFGLHFTLFFWKSSSRLLPHCKESPLNCCNETSKPPTGS